MKEEHSVKRRAGQATWDSSPACTWFWSGPGGGAKQGAHVGAALKGSYGC